MVPLQVTLHGKGIAIWWINIWVDKLCTTFMFCLIWLLKILAQREASFWFWILFWMMPAWPDDPGSWGQKPMKYPRYSRFVYGVMCNTPTAHHFYEDLLSSSLRINNPCESWLILVYPITIHYHKQCVPYFFPQNPWSSENQSMFSSSTSLWQNHFSQLVHNLFGAICWDQIFHFLGVAINTKESVKVSCPRLY